MTLPLENGMVLEFERFGSKPDADAEEEEFDSRPFFHLTVDVEKYQCGLEFNPK